MTCASCATRIERKLNKLDGVTASVSYATEKAVVAVPDTVTTERPAGHRRSRRVRRVAGARRTGATAWRDVHP